MAIVALEVVLVLPEVVPVEPVAAEVLALTVAVEPAQPVPGVPGVPLGGVSDGT